MSTYYVRSPAAGTADGSSWANAFATLAAAYSGKAAGDQFNVGDDEAETQGTSMTLTSPGTSGNPCNVIGTNTHVTTPPITAGTTATITTTGQSNMVFAGSVNYSGITFNCGTTSGASPSLNINGAAALNVRFSSCALKLLGTAAGNRFNFGATSNLTPQRIELADTPLTFSNAGQTINLGNCYLLWRDTASAVAGTVPTVLFTLNSGAGGRAEIIGVDLSALGSGKSLVSVGAANADHRLYFQNCKLGASVSAITGTIAQAGGVEVHLQNCDSGDTNYRNESYVFQGSIVTETTIKRTGGASDGTTGQSWKMVSLTTGPSYHLPLDSSKFKDIFYWAEVVGSPVTLTAHILHDSLTNLKDSEVWIEAIYDGDGSFPLSTTIRDRSTNLLATAADQDASTEAWTTTGITNVNKQKLNVTFTPEEKGVYRIRIMLAKANYTIYLCPKVEVS